MASFEAAAVLLATAFLGCVLSYEQEKGTVTMHSVYREERGVLPRDLRAIGSDVRFYKPVHQYPVSHGHYYPSQWGGFRPGYYGQGHRPGYYGHGHGHGHFHAGAHAHIGPHGIRFHGHIKHKHKKKPYKHKHKHKRRHRYDSWLY